MAELIPSGWLEELAEFLAIPSVSADPAHAADVSRAGEWVAEKVRALGGDAELREDGRLVVSEIAGPPGAPVVLVYGHYDVQPPAPLELWESEPFGAEVRGEWLYARGVADDKGQLWMQLKAIEELLSAGPPPVTFRVVCDGEEETGGDAIIRFLDGGRRARGRVRRPRWLDEDAQQARVRRGHARPGGARRRSANR